MPLVSFLRGLENGEACQILALLIHGAVSGVRTGVSSIPTVENIVFNLEVLLYCRDELRDPTILRLVEYGMELADIAELVPDKDAVVSACLEIEDLLKGSQR